MATYIIDSLLNNDVDNFTDTLNIHVLPSTNPDGYEYSQKSDRLWRKTRSNYNSIFLCKGVDGNRNWDYHWAGMFYTGSPPLTPSPKYHGIIWLLRNDSKTFRDLYIPSKKKSYMNKKQAKKSHMFYELLTLCLICFAFL